VRSDLLQLTDAFASAAIDPSQWIPALAMLADATGSARGQLIGVGGDATIPFNLINDFPERGHQQFLEIDGGNPHINSRIAASRDAPLLGLRSEADYSEEMPKLKSDAYMDWCSNYDIPYGCQCNLFKNDGQLVGLAVLRTESDGKTTAEQQELFTTIAPFVRHAVRMQMALEQDGPKLVAGALESVAAAVFVCTRGGRVLAHTSRAEAMLGNGQLSINGKMLRLSGHAAQEQLLNAIARHAGPIPVPLESIALHSGRGHDLPFILDIATIPHSPWRFNSEPQVLVIVRGSDRWHASSETVLQSLYGLSPAEVDIALRLARGQQRTTIGEERGARPDTVRAQIKAIFAKLGVAREAELVSMLGQLLRD
jgi:DNA-binding CsgD family transcriptional regulator